jgi:DNA-binding LacI/PurR family transcriptional regulator
MVSNRKTTREFVYEKLESNLRKKILSSKIDFEKPIMGEMELCERYQISRKSVRKALNNLANENLLIKVQGKGTFAVPPDIRIQAMTTKELNIMLVIPWFYMTSSEYNEKLIDGVSNYTAKAGHKLEYSDHEVNIKEIVSSHKKGKLDGIIWGHPDNASRETVKKIIMENIPVVAINRKITNCHSVSCDTMAELEETMSFLYEFGHRKIAFVNRSIKNQTHNARKEAFFDISKSYGLKNISELYVETDLQELLKALSKLFKAASPTALIVGGYMMLGGVLNFCRKNKINLPKDLSLISINDGYMARNYTTPVSAFTEPREKIGKQAIQHLEDVIAGRVQEETNITLKGELIIRKSCGLPRRRNLEL